MGAVELWAVRCTRVWWPAAPELAREAVRDHEVVWGKWHWGWSDGLVGCV